MGTIEIQKLTDAHLDAWDAFVRAENTASPFHLTAWMRAVSEGAGQETLGLMAYDGDKLVGVLPLSFRSSLLFGKAASSVMFGVYGGPLGRSDDVMSALTDAAWQHCKTRGVSSLEFRLKDRPQGGLDGFHATGDSAAFLAPIEPDHDARLKAIPRKQRAVVRKALKAGGQVVSGHEHLDRFYALYAESVRNLGTPVFPKALMRAFVRGFGEDVDIALVLAPDGEPVASLMSFYFRDHVLPYYAGSNGKARGLGAHDLMYFDLMERAYARGARVFDFGRSKIGSGPYHFKKNWGFEPQPLAYHTRVAEGEAAPDVSAASPKYAAMIKVWKKLPLPVANVLGPHLARHLG